MATGGDRVGAVFFFFLYLSYPALGSGFHSGFLDGVFPTNRRRPLLSHPFTQIFQEGGGNRGIEHPARRGDLLEIAGIL